VHIFAVGVTILALGGCANLSRSSTAAPLAPELARNSRVDEVVLASAPASVSPEFEAIFRLRVKKKLDECATGDRPLRLEASVERLTRTNPVMTAVLAGANVLRGSARLVDVETSAPAGEFQIGRTVVGARMGAIVMAQAEEQLSDAFGDELCKQAFPPRPPLPAGEDIAPEGAPASTAPPAGASGSEEPTAEVFE
jgi:hypothetical protein